MPSSPAAPTSPGWARPYILARQRDRRIEPFATYTLAAGTYPGGQPLPGAAADPRRRPDEPQRRARHAGCAEDPASTSGSLVPSVEFAALVSTPLPRYFAALVYAGNHDKALEALLEGRVDAAFVASERADAYLASHAVDPAKLQVLWRSAPIRYDPYVFSASLCPALKQRLRRRCSMTQGPGRVRGVPGRHRAGAGGAQGLRGA
jgi:phosphonate transport system substrate-binding protein